MNTVGGSWETPANWSLGAPSSTQTALITNGPSKFVYLQGFPPVGTLTISNLVISGPSGQTNTLQLSSLSSGPFVVFDGLAINSGGALRVLNDSSMRVDNVNGGGIRVDGELSMSSGTLVTTGSWIGVGYAGQGQMTINGGNLQARSVNLGQSSGSAGTLTFAGGTNTFTSSVWIGSGVGSTGFVWVTGGQVAVPDFYTIVGYSGFGQMVVSNGVWQGNELDIGQIPGSVGNLMVAGGSVSFTGSVYIGRLAGATGTVSITGGELVTTNNTVCIGYGGVGTMTVSGGTWQVNNIVVATNATSRGTLTIAGSAISVNTLLVGSNGVLSFTSGSLATKTVAVANAQVTIVGDGQQTATWIMLEGSHAFSNELRLGNSVGATGIVFLTGGSLVTPNVSTTIGGTGIGRMDISNGTWQSYMTDIGLTAGSSGTLTIAGGTNVVSYWLTVGDNATGMVRLTDGLLVVNNTTCLGYQTQGVGQVVVTGGTWTNTNLTVGNTSRAKGTLTFQGGTTVINGDFKIQGAGGTVLVAGGQLIANGVTYLSYNASGAGQMIVSNGLWQGQGMYVGRWSVGTLTIAGGTSSLNGLLHIGYDTVATGSLWITGGQLVTTNATNYVGYAGTGRATISNGLWMARDVVVNYYGAGSSGTLTVAGGTNILTGDLIVGYGSGGACTGFVWLTGGQLVTTNGTAYLGRRQGQLTVSNGTWLAGNVNLGYWNASAGTLTVAGGNVMVGNGAVLNVLRGGLSIGGGTTTVDRLMLTNGAASLFAFSAGTLNSRGTVVTNGATFVVGDGSHSATYRLDGGEHSFANSLYINPSAQLTGCGVIRGVFINKGSVLAGYPGGSLTVVGNVTNSGSIASSAGTLLVFSNLVVNTGTIDGSAGTDLVFAGGAPSGGTVRWPQATNSWISTSSDKWENGAFWSRGSAPMQHHIAVITNANSKTVTIDAATTNTPTMIITNLIVSAPVGATNVLALAGSGTATPLRTSGFTLDGNGIIQLSNAAVRVDNNMFVGNQLGGNQLIITGTSTFTNSGGYVGNLAGCSNNTVLVSGPSSVWYNQLNLYVGNQGASNRLTISDSAVVVNNAGFVSADSASSNNSVFVTGTGSVWSNAGTLYMGGWGADNQLTVTNGGVVQGAMVYLGYSLAAGRNKATITGTGSVWRSGNSVYVGFYGTANQLTVSDGGAVYDLIGCLGNYNISINNTALVTGAGSVWNNANALYVGISGVNNQLTVTAGGGVIAGTVVLGNNSDSSGNQLTVSNGWISVTNATSTGLLDVRRGAFMLNGGSVTVDNLAATYGASSVILFNGGLLRSKGTTINNGSALTVGDGAQAATYYLQSGTHSFANSLIISPNATLTGCGTILGAVTNLGSIAMGCSSVFSNEVFNNASIIISNSATVDFYSPVVNNGVINAILGTVNFRAGMSGGGLYLDANSDADGDGMSNLQEVLAGTDPTNSASVLRVLFIGTVGNDVQINWSAFGGKSYVVQTNASPSGVGFADFSPVISVPGGGATTTNYLDVGGATDFPTRFYRVRLVP